MNNTKQTRLCAASNVGSRYDNGGLDESYTVRYLGLEDERNGFVSC